MIKFSKRLFFYQIFIGLFLAAFISFYFFEIFAEADESGNIINMQKGIISGIIAFLVIMILAVVYAYFYHKFSFYQITDNKIICQRGVLYRKKSSVLINNIHSINKKQSIIQRLFKIASLKIDSGSANSLTEEIAIYTSQEEIESLYNDLKGMNKQNSTISTNLFEFNSLQKFIYALINTLFSLLFVILVIVYLELIFNFSMSNMDFPITSAIIVSLSLLGISFVLNVIGIFTRYYKFRIFKVNDEVEINYGFFIKYHNSFKLNKVKSIIISNNIIQKIFGLVTVKVQVIGYLQDAENEQGVKSVGILIPLCLKKNVNDIISQILPDYVYDNKQEKSVKLFPFIFLRFLFVTLATIIIESIILVITNLFKLNSENLVIASVVLIAFYLIVIVMMLIDAILKYKYSGMCINNGKITIYKGGLFQSIVVMKKENIIAIESVTTSCRMKKHIKSYIIHYATNILTNKVKVEMLNDDINNDLIDLLKY